MGFFSSRKEESASVTYTPRKEDKSVVQAIRSRFQSKKGKEREIPFARAPTSSFSVASSPSASIKHPRNIISVPSFRRSVLHRSASSFPLSHDRAKPVEPTSNPETPQSSHRTSISTVLRRATDGVTVTLAQRLNELASANSEGLLSDDEYRILRQSLFERFASSATVPIEASVVPVSPTSLESSNTLRIDRPASIISKSSETSDAHNIFRRVMDRRSYANNNKSETSSLMSTKSNTSLFKIPRLLSRKASDSSVRTAASRGQTDAISVSSRRISSEKSILPSTPRSAAGSIRRMPAPPSSFNARLISQARHSAIYNVLDENHLSTVQDIQQEISDVESEQKRLMDAFNGLELTTLTRRQRLPLYKISTSNLISGDSDGRSQRRDLTDDGISMRSGTSAGTSPSMARSAHGVRPNLTLALPIGSASTAVRRGSLSSVDDRRTPVPLSSPNSGHLQAASKSNISLLSSRVGASVMSDDERPMSMIHIDSLEGELEDVRRKREEVSHRYEARLEYLRAKLKGAQLHEKLMRR